MFRKQISPLGVALAVFIALAGITAVYWRLIVYQPELEGPGPGGPMGGAPVTTQEAGRRDVEVTTVAGAEPAYVDGPAWQARFCGPNDLAIASDGALIVSDSRNHRIRRIGADGTVTTLAGTLPPGATTGDGLLYPSGVAVAPDGSIYVADTGHSRIVRLAGEKQETIVEDPSLGLPVRPRFGSDGTLWVLDARKNAGLKVTPGKGAVPGEAPQEVRAQWGWPREGPPAGSVTASPGGDGEPRPVELPSGRITAAARLPGTKSWVAVSDETHAVFVIQPGGERMLIAGRLMPGEPIDGTGDGEGNVAGFNMPCAVVVGAGGEVFIADYQGNRVRQMTLPGWISGASAPPQERRDFFGRRRGGNRGRRNPAINQGL